MSGGRDCTPLKVFEEEDDSVGCYEKATDFKGHGLPNNKVELKALRSQAGSTIMSPDPGSRASVSSRLPRCLSGEAQLLPLDLEQLLKHLLAEVK